MNLFFFIETSSEYEPILAYIFLFYLLLMLYGLY